MKAIITAIVIFLLITSAFAQSPADGLQYIIFGDFGRNGNHNQTAVANQMSIYADSFGVDFIISTGDNFQYDGVISIVDSLWQINIENVYSAKSLMIPWYITIGNHDYRGNVQALIDYTMVSDRWYLPSRYYSLQKTIDDTTTIDFVFLDTSPYKRSYYSSSKYRNVVEQDTAAQTRWLDSTLSVSTALWKIVIGHHPIYSANPKHGNTRELIDQVKSVLEKYGVQAYFCGHDHDLQHLKTEGNIHYFVSGAGSNVRPSSTNDYTLFSASTPGFMFVDITSSSLNLRAINTHGEIIYETSIFP